MENHEQKKLPYDWVKIETDYVTDPTQTYESLSQEYGPSPKAICQHAQKGNWKGKRLAFEEKKRMITQEKLAEIQAKESADEIAKMNKAHYDSQQGLKYLADKQIITDVDKVKSGQTGELSAKDIHTLANTNKTIQESQRMARGLGDRELNVNLVYKQLAPLLENVVNIIEKHAPQTREAILREFRALYGPDVPGPS